MDKKVLLQVKLITRCQILKAFDKHSLNHFNYNISHYEAVEFIKNRKCNVDPAYFHLLDNFGYLNGSASVGILMNAVYKGLPLNFVKDFICDWCIEKDELDTDKKLYKCAGEVSVENARLLRKVKDEEGRIERFRGGSDSSRRVKRFKSNLARIVRNASNSRIRTYSSAQFI